jgi:hypothetical protein
MSDYLFDKKGEDPEIAKLEETLGALKYRAPEVPREERVQAPVVTLAPARRRVVPLAALALAAGVALWLGWRATQHPAQLGPYFDVQSVAGVLRVGDEKVAGQGRLPVGVWLETGESDEAKVKVATIGEVHVAPRSRLRLVGTTDTEHRMELQRGELHARVVAPPRLFVVDTPAASAVDLGCAYTLKVDDRGHGRLEVQSGQVSLEGKGRASLVPARAVCETRPGAGPGTPYMIGAPADLVDALRRFDFEAGGDAALDAVLRAAGERDSLTLWHLVARTDGDQRQRALERLHAVRPPSWGGGVPNAKDFGPDRLEEYKRDLVTHW